MIIKKFSNGNINMRLEKCDVENRMVNENIYHDDMFMSDLYIEQGDDGYSYILDHNKQLVYYLGSYMVQNPLKWLLDTLQDAYNNSKTVKIYPYKSKTLYQEIIDSQEEVWYNKYIATKKQLKSFEEAYETRLYTKADSRNSH